MSGNIAALLRHHDNADSWQVQAYLLVKRISGDAGWNLRRSCQLVQHQIVLWEYSNFTETIMSNRVSSEKRVNCREDIAAAKRENTQRLGTSKSCAGCLGTWHVNQWHVLHLPQFAGHFQPVHPDTAVLSSVVTALRPYRVTFQRRVDKAAIKKKVCRGHKLVVWWHRDRVQAKYRSIFDTIRYHWVSITIRYSMPVSS